MNPSQRIEEHTMCLKVMHLEIGLFSMAFFYRILVKIDEISLIDQIKTFVPNFFVESDQLIKTGSRNLEKDQLLYKTGIYILAIPPPPLGGGKNFVKIEKQGRI